MKGGMSLLLLCKKHFKIFDKGQLLQITVQKEKEGVWGKEVLLEKDTCKAMAFGVTQEMLLLCVCFQILFYFNHLDQHLGDAAKIHSKVEVYLYPFSITLWRKR